MVLALVELLSVMEPVVVDAVPEVTVPVTDKFPVAVLVAPRVSLVAAEESKMSLPEI